MKTRKALALVYLLMAAMPAAAQDAAKDAARDYPSRLIRIVSPYPPGGPTDVIARILGREMEKMWGQTVIIENRAGGSGTTGAGYVARAAPDGYTLLMNLGSHTTAIALMKLPYDGLKDLTAVSAFFSVPHFLVTNPASPYRTVADVVAKAKADPGGLSYSTAAYGSVPHLIGLAFEKAAGITLTHVPFRGGPAAMEAILTNSVPLSFAGLSNAMPFLQNDSVRMIAITMKERSARYPNVPTFGEAGYPSIVQDSWFGMLAPAGTPKPILEKLHAAIQTIIAQPEVREKFVAQGYEPVSIGPDAFQAQLVAEVATYGKLAKETDLKLDP